MAKKPPRVTWITHPSELPLFVRPTSPDPNVSASEQELPGRIRSSFTLPTDLSIPVPLAAAVAPPADVPRFRHEQRPESFAGVDWAVVAALRAAASERLMRAIELDPRLDRDQHHAIGRRIIAELLEEELKESASAGRGTVDRSEQAAMAQAVFDALFRLGRLQPLVDDPKVENVTILGHDDVWLEYEDGRLVRGPAVADSDAELIDFLVFLASRSEVNARQFSEAEPRLHLRLDGGARLAATAWVTPRPSVVIRRHRLREATLAQLVRRGSMGPIAASFLAAAVRARKSIVVAGPQGAGKTTMLRALCAEIDPMEAIGTFETEYELHLHELKERHPIVHAWEARPGGEMQANGRRAGEFTVDDALYDSFRFNLSRQIVGEVRGKEVLAMLEAMQAGTGSLSTTHAESAASAMNRLVTCAMKAGPHVTHEYAVRAIATAVNIIVHVDLRTDRQPDGSYLKRRWTSEIAVVSPGERELGYAMSSVFRAPAGSSRLRAVGGLPDEYRDLARWGFDLAEYLHEVQAAAS
jgi:pilus assembly protein CpaF